MKRKDFLSYLLLGILLAAAITFIWNYKTTLPWLRAKASSVLTPILGGVAIGFIMNIPASFLERKIRESGKRFVSKHSMALALLVSTVLLAVFIALVFTLVLPELINAITLFVSSLRDFAADSHFWNETDISSIPILSAFFGSADSGILTLADAIDQKINEFTPSIISYTISTVQAMISSVVIFFVSFVFAIYFIANKKRLQRHILKLLALFVNEKKLSYIRHAASISALAFSRFITAQVMEALIIGSLCFGGMLVLGFPYAPTVGILTAVMALIPVYGAVIGALAGAFMIAVAEPWKGLFFLIFIIVLQQLEGNLIYPRVVGTTTGVPSVYVFMAVTLGGALFGIPGMLLAVPVFSIAFTLLKEISEKRNGALQNQDNQT